MRLISLKANKASFRTVNFNENGLSFIVAKQSSPGLLNEKGKTYNGVGKSLMIAIIHFCLGAGEKHYRSFCEKLYGWEFYLEFRIGDVTYTSQRGANNPKVIIFDGEELGVGKFNSKMAELCFKLPEEIKYLSFRSLIPFFIRPGLESYVAYDKPAKSGSEYQKMLSNAFLAGLDVWLAQQKIDLKKEKDRIKTLTDNIKKDNLLREFFSGNRDVRLALKDLDERIQKLEGDIKDYRIAEDYHEVKVEADRIERDLAVIGNQVVLFDNQLQNISRSLRISPDIGKENIEKIYNETGIFFPNQVTIGLDQLMVFYRDLIKNRQKKLLEQKGRIDKERTAKVEIQKNLQKELDNNLQYLGAHQALDVFVKVTQRLGSLRLQKDNLVKYETLMAKYRTTDIEIKGKMLEAVRRTDIYLDEAKDVIDSIQDYFRRLAKRFYPEATAGITVYNNEGDNQSRYAIDARIDADASDGINHVKIFCYDLTILFKGFGHNVNFVFHDSRLFDGIDERQKTELFKIVAEMFSNSKYQYIATVNQNQLEEIKRYLSDDEFNNVVQRNTVLTLTDESDAERLLGIKVDIKYE